MKIYKLKYIPVQAKYFKNIKQDIYANPIDMTNTLLTSYLFDLWNKYNMYSVHSEECISSKVYR